jgi:hypothetical protein
MFDHFFYIRLRAENAEAQAKGVQSKQEADPFSRYVFGLMYAMCVLCMST